MKLTHNQIDKSIACLYILLLALLIIVVGLSPEYNKYDNNFVPFNAINELVDIRKMTSNLYIVPVVLFIISLITFNLPKIYRKSFWLVLSSTFIVITTFYWILYQIDTDLLASAIVISIMSIVYIFIYIISENALILMNSTKYQYFDHTSFYASDERKPKMFVEKDVNELLWYIDKLAPSKDDKTYLVTQNSYLHGLLSCVKETQYVLKRKDYNYVVKKLNEYIGDGGIEVLKAYEAKAIIESCSIVIDKD